ncbi:MAG: DNA polymerase III subunit delta' [Pseudomonadota bacterium]
MSQAEEPDRVGDAPHPRETAALFGQADAEQAFLQAEAAGRLHHAWLLTGPHGVGKATLAWRIARHLIARAWPQTGLSLPPDAAPQTSLQMDPTHPVFRRCAALSEPRLTLIRRGRDERTERLRGEITVNEIRALRGSLQLSAADGGWRVVIVDAAEEMNGAAANALLKFLEEPPPRVLFALVSHRPARLLPTIRSRCRFLRLPPLDAAPLGQALAMATGKGRGPAAAHASAADDPLGEAGEAAALAELAALSGGSVGEALRLAAGDGRALYADLIALLAGLPTLDRSALATFAASLSGRGAEGRRDLAERLLALSLARLARSIALPGSLAEAAAGEMALARRFAAHPGAAQRWAELAQRLPARLSQARSVNLDPSQVMLDTFLQIEETARRLPPAAA